MQKKSMYEQEEAQESNHNPTVFSLDFGTSSVKAGLIDLAGTLLWSGHRTFPQVPNYTNWHTNQWIVVLEEVCAEFKDFLHKTGCQTPNAISLSGNGPTLVALGSGYQNQRRTSWPVFLWMTAESLPVKDDPSLFLPMVNWAKKHDPTFHQIERFIPTAEYIAWILCGVECSISPHEQFSQYMWSRESLDNYELSAQLFPEYMRPGEIIGRLDRLGAQITSLPLRLPIFAGGSDFLMSLLGTGVISEGLCCNRAGTSEGINYCNTHPVSADGLQVLPHFINEYYNVAGTLSCTGRMFEWFRGITHQRSHSYTEMMEAIATVKTKGSSRDKMPCFFPSLNTVHNWEFRAGMFSGLYPEHGSKELGRAVVEAIGFSIRSVLERLTEAGCSVNTMRSCGGQAKNSLWCQMKANISGVNIEIPRIEDAELTGSAIIGFMGLGYISSLKEGVQALVHIERCFQPELDQVNLFLEGYHSWMQSLEQLQKTNIEIQNS